MLGHEVEHPAGQLVVVDPRVPRRGDRVHGPRIVAVDEELLPLATLMAQPVVDRLGGDRRGQRAEVLRRRGGDAGELLEAPVREGRVATRRVAERERVGPHRLGPEGDGVDVALFRAEAPGARRVVEGLNAGVPFVGWTRGPFPVSRVRGDSRHTCSSHGVLLCACPGGDVWDEASRRAT